MITVKVFIFGPFQENTYVLFDSTKECVIIDPGCYDDKERNELAHFISDYHLKPVLLLNTHGHIDHVIGNRFVFDKYGLLPQIHKEDLPALKSLLTVAKLYNLNAVESTNPEVFLEEGDEVKFGNSTLRVLFTPGHSPGSICFVYDPQKIIIGGDVLFYGSIGRTDLPGGSHQTLLNSIHTKLLPLEDEFRVYSGHGPDTTIGEEKRSNPFLHEYTVGTNG
jgi:hydroxyacylglutathione hydrolase